MVQAKQRVSALGCHQLQASIAIYPGCALNWHCPSWSEAQSWARNRRHLANVGSTKSGSQIGAGDDPAPPRHLALTNEG